METLTPDSKNIDLSEMTFEEIIELWGWISDDRMILNAQICMQYE